MGGGLSVVDRARIARLGIAPLSDERALELFDAALVSGEPVLVPTGIDTTTLHDPHNPPHALLRSIARQAGPPAEAEPAPSFAHLPDKERHEALLALVRQDVAHVLGHASPRSVPVDRGLLQLGMDSLGAVELRNRLGTATGLRLPTTLVFDHPTVTALADYLAQATAPEEPTAALAPDESETAPQGRLDSATDDELFKLIDDLEG
ncbi:beta-ketoacyl reductase [Streptomyces sp. RKAG290]|nr:beta-ketoacyl reductase [Streptomyces sp. RKAG290]